MYELNPEETDRFYQKLYGKTYSETVEENDLEEKYGDNPDMMEVRKN